MSMMQLNFPVLILFYCLLCGFSCQSGNAEIAKPAALSAAIRDSLPNPIVDEPYLLGKFDPATHPDFVIVGKPYTDKPGMMLRKESFAAFQKMYEAAKKEGVTLKIISSTRTFTQQKQIWNGKWTRFAKEAPDPVERALKILEYSAMPGASRHHWGTDIDLNDLNNPSFEKKGKHATAYEWLRAHAREYGYCQPYTAKDAQRPEGYNEERWHWSYTPLSKPMLAQYLKLISDQQFDGFEGSETALKIKVVEKYAAGINQDCK